MKLLIAFLFYMNVSLATLEVPQLYSQLTKQKIFSLLDFKIKNSIIHSIEKHINELSPKQQLRFYFLANYYLDVQVDSKHEKYVDKALELSKHLNDEMYFTYFSFMRFNSDNLNQKIELKKEYYQLVDKLNTLKDTTIKAVFYLVLSRENNSLKNRYEQLSSLYQGIDVLESKEFINDEFLEKQLLLAEFYNELGNYYSKMFKYKKSEQNFLKALKIFENYQNKSRLGITKFNLGNLALKTGDYKKAKKLYLETVAI